jgi:TP901 family phage tail tape measure protein
MVIRISESQFKLRMILDASGFVSGTKQSQEAIEKLSSAAAASGQTLDQYARGLIKQAEVAQRAGALNREQTKTLELIKQRFSDLAQSLQTTDLSKLSPFADMFQKALAEQRKLLALNRDIKVSMDSIFRARIAQTPFSAITADLRGIQREYNRLRTVQERLFGAGLASAHRMREVFRSFQNVMKDTAGPSDNVRESLIRVRDAITQIKVPDKAASDVAKLDSRILKLAQSTDIGAREMVRIRQEVRSLLANIVGVDRVTKKMGEAFATSAGKADFKRQLQEILGMADATRRVVTEEQRRFQELVKISSLIKEIKRIGGESKGLRLVSQIQSFDKAIREQKRLSDAIKGGARTVEQAQRKYQALESFMKKYGDLAKSNVAPTGRLRAEMTKLAAQMGVSFTKGQTFAEFMRILGARAKRAKTELDQLTRATERYTRVQRAAKTGMEKFNELVTVAIGKIIRYRVAFFLMSKAIQGLRSAIETFRSVQLELANIEKVIEPVAGVIGKLKTEAFDFAITFGQSVNDVLNIMKIFAQQGKNFQQIVDLTRTTLLAASGANLTTAQSVEALTAIMKAYNIEASKLIGVVDKLANVQANFAVTAQELANGIKLIAAAANNVGISLDELLGQITAIATVTRRSGKNIAQSLKTIFARVERSRTINEFRKLNIAIQNTDGSIRNLSDVLTDLNRVWDTLSDAQRFNLAQVTAGVRRYTDFLVLMDNYDEALAATAKSLEAQGQATRNTLVELATFDKQVKATQATLQSVFDRVASSGLIQAASGLLEIVRLVAELGRNSRILSIFAAGMTIVATNLFLAKSAAIIGTVALGAFAKNMALAGGVTNKLNKALVAGVGAKRALTAQEVIGNARLLDKIKLNIAVLRGDKAAARQTFKNITAHAALNSQIDAGTKKKLVAGVASKAFGASMASAAKGAGVLAISLRGVGIALRTIFGGPAGIIFGAIAVMELLGFLFRKQTVENQQFAQSTIEVAQALATRLKVEKEVLSSAERQITRFEILGKEVERRLSISQDLLTAYRAELDAQRAQTDASQQFIKRFIDEQNALRGLGKTFKELDRERESLGRLRIDFELLDKDVGGAASSIDSSIFKINDALRTIGGGRRGLRFTFAGRSAEDAVTDEMLRIKNAVVGGADEASLTIDSEVRGLIRRLDFGTILSQTFIRQIDPRILLPIGKKVADEFGEGILNALGRASTAVGASLRSLRRLFADEADLALAIDPIDIPLDVDIEGLRERFAREITPLTRIINDSFGRQVFTIDRVVEVIEDLGRDAPAVFNALRTAARATGAEVEAAALRMGGGLQSLAERIGVIQSDAPLQITYAGKTPEEAGIEAIEGLRDTFVSLGPIVAEDIKAGLDSSLADLNIGATVTEAARETLSPDSLRGIGSGASQGLIQGMTEGLERADEAISDQLGELGRTASEAGDALEEAFGRGDLGERTAEQIGETMLATAAWRKQLEELESAFPGVTREMAKANTLAEKMALLQDRLAKKTLEVENIQKQLARSTQQVVDATEDVNRHLPDLLDTMGNRWLMIIMISRQGFGKRVWGRATLQPAMSVILMLFLKISRLVSLYRMRQKRLFVRGFFPVLDE